MALSSQDDPPIYPQAPFLHKVHRVSPQLYRGLFRMAKRTLGNWSQPVYAFRQELGLPPPVGDPLLEGQFSPTMTLALFSRLLAQPQADWPPRTRVTGFPFHDSQTGDEKFADELRAFVETHGPPLVFTLGSTAVHDAGDFYTVSAQAAHALQRPALLITGPDPRNRPTRLNDSTLALEYVPYNWVFQHAAVVVHQGGIGTTGQAMRAARPMLVVPFSHDQPDNAYRVAALGIAATLPRRKYTAATAAKALRPLLDNPAFARRAAEVGHEIAQEDGVAAACVALEEAFTLGSSNRRAAPSAIQPA
jgi:UDP:flavonoid glycosyltransferase YjiC (YdhE family)